MGGKCSQARIAGDRSGLLGNTFYSAYGNFGKHWQTGIFGRMGPTYYLLVLLAKVLFFDHKATPVIPSVQKPNYRTDLNVSVTCQNLHRYKFTSFVRWRFLSHKKIRIKNHQSQPAKLADPVCFIQHLFSLKYRSYLLFADTSADIVKDKVQHSITAGAIIPDYGS